MAKAQTQTQDRKVFEVELSEVQSLFIGLGFATADKWDRVKLVKKLENLPKILKQAGEVPLTDVQTATMNSLLNAMETGAELALLDGTPAVGTPDPEPVEEPTAPADGKTKKTPAAKKTPTAKKPDDGKPKLTRYQIPAQIIVCGKRKTWALDDLAAAANAEFMEQGGKDNVKEAKFSANVAADVLAACGVIKYDKPNITRLCEQMKKPE